MTKQRQGLSNRQYAKHAGVSAPYVQKLVNRGKIPVLEDGSLDAAACDLARSRNTISGRGQRRLQRRRRVTSQVPAGSYAECVGCGESFRVLDSRNLGTPKFSEFCTPNCQVDAEAGLSLAQIRRRVGREARESA